MTCLQRIEIYTKGWPHNTAFVYVCEICPLFVEYKRFNIRKVFLLFKGCQWLAKCLSRQMHLSISLPRRTKWDRLQISFQPEHCYNQFTHRHYFFPFSLSLSLVFVPTLEKYPFHARYNFLSRSKMSDKFWTIE